MNVIGVMQSGGMLIEVSESEVSSLRLLGSVLVALHPQEAQAPRPAASTAPGRVKVAKKAPDARKGHPGASAGLRVCETCKDEFEGRTTARFCKPCAKARKIDMDRAKKKANYAASKGKAAAPVSAAKPVITKVCAICQEQYQANGPAQKYCLPCVKMRRVDVMRDINGRLAKDSAGDPEGGE